MAKASIRLADGTSVQIDGSPEEVAELLALYGGKSTPAVTNRPSPTRTKRAGSKPRAAQPKTSDVITGPDLSVIVNLIKTCDEAEAIEATILDKIGQLERILLPPYIVHEYLDNAHGLTSGEISQITKDLGVPVARPNASKMLSGTASRYVVGDKVRKKGQAVRYKISRRGLQYLKTVLSRKPDGK